MGDSPASTRSCACGRLGSGTAESAPAPLPTLGRPRSWRVRNDLDNAALAPHRFTCRILPRLALPADTPGASDTIPGLSGPVDGSPEPGGRDAEFHPAEFLLAAGLRLAVHLVHHLQRVQPGLVV